MNAVTTSPQICAHAGCEGFPLDGLEAIDAGIRAGAHFVELDLRFTADGTPVLSHDPLGARPRSALVTLDAALDFLAEYPAVGINVDVKERAALTLYPSRITLGSVVNPLYCTGLRSHQLASFRKACPGLAHTLDNLPWWFRWVQTKDKAAYLSRQKAAGVQALNLPYPLVDEALMEASRLAGLPVRVWTVDDPAVMARMVALGVESITTNRVAELARLLA